MSPQRYGMIKNMRGWYTRNFLPNKKRQNVHSKSTKKMGLPIPPSVVQKIQVTNSVWVPEPLWGSNTSCEAVANCCLGGLHRTKIETKTQVQGNPLNPIDSCMLVEVSHRTWYRNCSFSFPDMRSGVSVPANLYFLSSARNFTMDVQGHKCTLLCNHDLRCDSVFRN